MSDLNKQTNSTGNCASHSGSPLGTVPVATKNKHTITHLIKPLKHNVSKPLKIKQVMHHKLNDSHAIDALESTAHLKKIAGSLQRKLQPIKQFHHVLFGGDWTSTRTRSDSIFFGDINGLYFDNIQMTNTLRLGQPSIVPQNRERITFSTNVTNELQYNMLMNNNQYIHYYHLLPQDLTINYRGIVHRYIKQEEERRWINNVMFDVTTYIRKNQDNCCNCYKRLKNWFSHVFSRTPLDLPKITRSLHIKYINMDAFIKIGSTTSLWFINKTDSLLLNYPTKAIQIGVAVTLTSEGSDATKLKYYSLASITEITSPIIILKNYRIIADKCHYTDLDVINTEHCIPEKIELKPEEVANVLAKAIENQKGENNNHETKPHAKPSTIDTTNDQKYPDKIKTSIGTKETTSKDSEQSGGKFQKILPTTKPVEHQKIQNDTRTKICKYVKLNPTLNLQNQEVNDKPSGKLQSKLYTINTLRADPSFKIGKKSLEFIAKNFKGTPMVFKNLNTWQLDAPVNTLLNTSTNSCGFETVQYYLKHNIELTDEIKTKCPMRVDEILNLAHNNGLNLMVYHEKDKLWYTRQGLTTGLWATAILRGADGTQVGHYMPVKLRNKYKPQRKYNQHAKGFRDRGAGFEDIDNNIDNRMQVPATNIGKVTNCFNTSILPTTSKSKQIDPSGEGCEPEVSNLGNIHAYVCRYHNKAKHITENNMNKLFNYAHKFSKLIKSRLPPLRPHHSKKQLNKYKRWFDEHKISTMPEKHSHNIFIKREYYDDQNRSRVISDVDKITTIRLLAYVNPLHKAMRDHIRCYRPGKPKDSANIHENPGYGGCDCSGLDGTIGIYLRECERIFLTTIYPDYANDINNLMDSELYGLFSICNYDLLFNMVIPTMGTRLSGSALTSLGNTFIMMFIQWMFFVSELKYTYERAFNSIGWCYGDDTTFPNKYIKQFQTFASTLGIDITQEQSKNGTIMFLSELVTPYGNIVDVNRLISKAYRYFSPFSDVDGFIYKLTGYYNPNKNIFNDQTLMYQQSPCFSLFGYYAYLIVQSTLPRNNTLTVDEILARKYNILGDNFRYNLEEGHEWAPYDEYFPGITKIHLKYRKLLKTCMAPEKYEDKVKILASLFTDMLADLKPVETRSIKLNPKKTLSVANDIILQHGGISIELNPEPQIRFLQFVYCYKSQALALALCNKYQIFWNRIVCLIDKGMYYKDYRAAAEKLSTYFLLYYKQLKQNKTSRTTKCQNKTQNQTTTSKTQNQSLSQSGYPPKDL